MVSYFPYIFLFLSVSFKGFALSNEAAQIACNQLASTLGTTLIENSTGPDFNNTVSAPRNLFNTQINFSPACIVLAQEASDVQVAMKTIFQHEVDYAVLAGGHSANEGWDNVNGGILISFERMDQVSYDPQRDTITIQPGVRWGPAAVALEPQGVAPVGGRVDDVGTGLLLGGGLSFLSQAHGFSADNFVELDVVLVNGSMVTATAVNEYADLFRALKGGANRFGIVTRYEVQAIHTGKSEEKTWFGGSITYPEDSFEDLARAISHFVHDNVDPRAVHLSNFARVGLTTTATATLFYNGSTLPQDIFGEFLSIPSLSSNLTSLSYLDIALALAGTSPLGQGTLLGAKALIGGSSSSDDSTDQLYLNTLHLWKNLSDSFSPSEIAISTLDFTPVPISQISYGRPESGRGGNAIDPPLVGYNQIVIGNILPVGVKVVSEEIEDAVRLFLEQAPSSPGIPLFINECDSNQEVFATYGGYDFLKATYAKYDPTRFNIRHTNGPIGL
ncbi:hypothetical protein D9758_011139 [Tetrapyrgos nigripes]|uniref:FAD-binding PCMH-type domain-containing protein n=1 Tax=Tetrapyrgos nigripes TaxID=182062 RepID=A0A8H5CKN4_9AGAR|nr:hypothetical protein D9758_011139 [Tetrapyrgos nigripes]